VCERVCARVVYHSSTLSTVCVCVGVYECVCVCVCVFVCARAGSLPALF